MAITGLVKRSSQCSPAHYDRRVTEYCFGDLTKGEQRAFEAHLLECDFCWNKVQWLDPSIKLLRTDRTLAESSAASDMFSILGISSKIAWPFGGHIWHVVVSCGLYGLLYTVALFVEIAYRFDRFASTAIKIAPLIFFWVMGTSIAGLGIDWKWTQRGKTTGLAFSLPIFIVAALLLYAALGLYLPGDPITEATFQTYSAHGAYLKSVYYFLPLAVLFLILPFHFVVTLQRELEAGRHRLGLALLTGKQWSVAPRGATYLRVWWLAILLFCAGVVSLALTAHLLESLKPGVYMNLFIQFVQWRLILYFGLGLECLLWYYKSVNEIKRECVGAALSSSAVQ